MPLLVVLKALKEPPTAVLSIQGKQSNYKAPMQVLWVHEEPHRDIYLLLFNLTTAKPANPDIKR